MKAGDTIKFEFAGKKKDGVVHRVCPNTVYIKTDFPKHKGKLVKRKLSELDAGKTKEKKSGKK